MIQDRRLTLSAHVVTILIPVNLSGRAEPFCVGLYKDDNTDAAARYIL
jgi:hypothetical protein